MILVIMNIYNTDKIKVKIVLIISIEGSFFCFFVNLKKYILLYMDFGNLFSKKGEFFKNSIDKTEFC